MAYEVELKELQPQPTIGIRSKVVRSELDRALSNLLPQANRYLEEQNLQPAGQPYVRYFSSRQVERVEIDLEVGFPLFRAVEVGEGDVIAGKLPGGPAIVTRYEGPYDGVSEAYETLETWIEANDRYEAAGAPWEQYLAAPEAVDEAALQLEIVYPVQEVNRAE